MSDYTPALLPVCGQQRWLPDDHLPTAAALAPPGLDAPHHLERELRCVLQRHTTGPHHALAMDLPGPHTGALWATWTTHTSPLRLTVHPRLPRRLPHRPPRRLHSPHRPPRRPHLPTHRPLAPHRHLNPAETLHCRSVHTYRADISSRYIRTARRRQGSWG